MDRLDKQSLLRAACCLILVLATASCGMWLDDEARMERARHAFADGEYASAIIDLKSVLLRAPDNREARQLLGLALLADGQAEPAVKELERALHLGVPLDAIRARLAMAYVESGQPGRALEIANAELATDAEQAYALWLSRGDAEADLGRTIAALRSFRSAAELEVDTAQALVRMSDALWNAGSSGGARRYAEDALRADAANVAARIALARIDIDAGNLQSATDNLQHAVQLQPLRPTDEGYIHYYFGMIALENGDLAAARAALEQVSSRWSPTDPDRLYLAGSLALAEGDYDLAAEALQGYLGSYAESNSARRMLGEAQFGRGLLNQARSELASAVESRPWQAANRSLLARTYLLQGQAELAREVLLPVLDIDPVEPEALAMLGLSELRLAVTGVQSAALQKGQEELIRGEIGPALATLRVAAADSPDDPQALELLGLAYLAGGHPAAAAAAFSSALAAAPEDRLRLQLSRAQLANGAFAAGLKSLDAIDSGIPSPATAMTRRALVTRFSESLQVAGQPQPGLLEAWLETSPDDVEARWMLAVTYFEMQRYADAARQFERLAAQLPEDAAIHNNLAWCYLRLQDGRALGQAERAYALAPETADIIDTLGWMLVTSGQVARGLPLLEDAHLLLPARPESTYRLAYALSRASQEKRASKLLEALLRDGAGAAEGPARELLASLAGASSGR